jgi:ComF family protein
MIDALLNLLFPNACVVCNRKILERKWGAACPDCWAALEPVPSPVCPCCGMHAPAIEGRCDACRRGDHAFDFARSVFIFNDRMREIIHHLKYSGRVSLARPLGRALENCLRSEDFRAQAVVPVPLHRARARERGFNQAELLARTLELRVESRALRRIKNTPSQTGLTRPQRAANLAGAFRLKGQLPACVVVVDDVYTTGSTLDEIARTLKCANVSRVEVLTAARVPRLG